jgi:GTP-binding protein YchF
VKLGIIGLTQSGKTTAFFALTGQTPEAAGLVGKHRAVVPVPDERLDILFQMYPRDKRVPATVEFIDCGEIPRDSSAYWANVRLADALVHVAAGFDPMSREERDSSALRAAYNELNAELVVSDLDIIERRRDKLSKQIKRPIKTQEQDLKELALLERMLEAEKASGSFSDIEISDSEEKLLRGFQLLTRKTEMVLLNLSENAWSNRPDNKTAFPEDTRVIEMCAILETELAQLDESERDEFAEAYEITEPVGPRAITAAYDVSGSIRFYTVGKDEVRAWAIPDGLPAKEAAAKVHTDMAKGFIRAKTIAFDDLDAHGSEKAVKEKGLVRLEGKDYRVADGDVIEFHFSK